MAVELRFSEVAGLINHSRTTQIDLSPVPSVVTSNPAKDGHRKTGQWDGPGRW